LIIYLKNDLGKGPEAVHHTTANREIIVLKNN